MQLSSSDTSSTVENRLQQAHPWHGVEPKIAEDRLLVYIENIAFAVIKYEVDEGTGLLKVDHPQETSALLPAAYGFVPRTLCGSRVAKLNTQARGDRAPLDVFVLSERALSVPGVLAEARVIGGIPVKDSSFTDDKLIAVLHKDAEYGHMQSISEVPVHVLDRICDYLLHESPMGVAEIGDPFGPERAFGLLLAAMEDYAEKFPRE